VFVSGNPILKPIHTFLFNRWYMNSTYYKVFVYGLIDFAKVLFAYLESLVFDKITSFVSDSTIALGKVLHFFETKYYDPAINIGIPTILVDGSKYMFKNLETQVIDNGYNYGIPIIATRLHHRLKKIQTGILSYNILYITILFIFLILGLLAIQMRGVI
jgi:NADH:ubiquinone oxidoreductase subunit 5 (subunit L)/multisubunit Na+/H+ antiporter MnhA subunit